MGSKDSKPKEVPIQQANSSKTSTTSTGIKKQITKTQADELRQQKEEDDLIYEGILQFLTSPQWKIPIYEFLDENCILFDEEDENQIGHLQIHKNFITLIEGLIEELMTMLDIEEEVLRKQVERGLRSQKHKKYYEQLLVVDNFLIFKKIMIKRNKELELEAMKELAEDNPNDLALIRQAELDKERAELEHVLALSMAVEEQRRQLLEEEEDTMFQEALRQSEILQQQECSQTILNLLIEKEQFIEFDAQEIEPEPQKQEVQIEPEEKAQQKKKPEQIEPVQQIVVPDPIIQEKKKVVKKKKLKKVVKVKNCYFKVYINQEEDEEIITEKTEEQVLEELRQQQQALKSKKEKPPQAEQQLKQEPIISQAAVEREALQEKLVQIKKQKLVEQQQQEQEKKEETPEERKARLKEQRELIRKKKQQEREAELDDYNKTGKKKPEISQKQDQPLALDMSEFIQQQQGSQIQQEVQKKLQNKKNLMSKIKAGLEND